jgi:hypothetical protein
MPLHLTKALTANSDTKPCHTTSSKPRPDMRMLDRDREHSVRTLQLYLTPAEAAALADKLRRLLLDAETVEHDHVLSDDASRDLSFSLITANKLRDIARYTKLEQRVLQEN